MLVQIELQLRWYEPKEMYLKIKESEKILISHVHDTNINKA